jgi:hypothetical protein
MTMILITLTLLLVVVQDVIKEIFLVALTLMELEFASAHLWFLHLTLALS